MNKVNKYKQLLSALLLIVYVFVTTPVQWLHYHESDQVSEKQLFYSEDKVVFSDQDSNQNSEDCSICLHKYSSYNNDFFHPQLNSIVLESTVVTGWIKSHFLSTVSKYGNKGPPSLS